MLAAILLCGTTVLEPGARGFTRGVLHDEWSETVIGSDALSMYEFRRAVEASQIPHFDGVFMHSCLMGNMESLADLYPTRRQRSTKRLKTTSMLDILTTFSLTCNTMPIRWLRPQTMQS